MSNYDIKLNPRFYKKLSRSIEQWEFKVGILEDKEHKQAVEHGLLEKPQLSSYAGGPIRKTAQKKSGKSIGDILIENMERLGVNLLTAPFEKKSSDILKFTTEFLKMAVSEKMNPKRVVNLLQAVVRNPILRQDYGPNKATTADNKGFDRNLFDTAQLFKAIKAEAKRV